MIQIVPISSDALGLLEGQLCSCSLTKDQIVNYLRKGTSIVVARMRVPDRFDQSQAPIPYHLLTDGSWVWSSELTEYVDRYQHGLPEGLLASIVDRQGRPFEELPQSTVAEVRTWLAKIGS